ncbi:squalene/phytoene synthase family protein [Tranquillimonas alkanivorans]|uniref:Squalene/phytoene synthase n=1 Tax=Tranquillimonas alkanivorans TaxID=441119 RepID=A0A1I5R8I0_9RHOB|nr:squalene/phytoene synthase family protein [Tranquillimonas alkanivorans]SFP54803.1 Squalene/phytoene synthase [Tranquillimonas alkanivorans]
MTLQACAELVERGDPDRFLAAMAAPPAARDVLFPVYAFNLEVARAPWVTQEPMIAEMRLQWWRDALEEIASGSNVRRHEVVGPLSEVLDAEGARLLDDLIEARRRDIEGEPFEDEAAFWAYLDATAGHLMWVAARALGAAEDDQPEVRRVAQAQGLANWFLAIPELEARGRRPLADGRGEAVQRLAREGLQQLRGARVSRVARPAVLPAWRAGALLGQAAEEPGRVAEGRLVQSEFARRAGLMRFALIGR